MRPRPHLSWGLTSLELSSLESGRVGWVGLPLDSFPSYTVVAHSWLTWREWVGVAFFITVVVHLRPTIRRREWVRLRLWIPSIFTVGSIVHHLGSANR